MPTAISIKRRILRRVAAALTATSEIGTCYLWDARGNVNLGNNDALVFAGDEEVEDSGVGADGYVERRLDIIVAVCVVPDEQDSIDTTQLRSSLEAAVEKTLASNYNWIDVSPKAGEVLAVDTIIRGALGPDYVEGRADVQVRATIVYQTSRVDPYIGPGVTLLEES